MQPINLLILDLISKHSTISDLLKLSCTSKNMQQKLGKLPIMKHLDTLKTKSTFNLNTVIESNLTIVYFINCLWPYVSLSLFLYILFDQFQINIVRALFSLLFFLGTALSAHFITANTKFYILFMALAVDCLHIFFSREMLALSILCFCGLSRPKSRNTKITLSDILENSIKSGSALDLLILKSFLDRISDEIYNKLLILSIIHDNLAIYNLLENLIPSTATKPIGFPMDYKIQDFCLITAIRHDSIDIYKYMDRENPGFEYSAGHLIVQFEPTKIIDYIRQK